MKITDAAAILQQAAVDVAGLPLEMATAIHASAAGITQEDLLVKNVGQANPMLSTADQWKMRREMAEGRDITDHPPLDGPINALQDAIIQIRNAFPKPGAP